MRESLRILKAADPPNELRLALTQTGLGEILVMTGKFQEAERNLMDALTVLQKNPQDWGAAAGAMNNLGAVRFFQGNLAEAGRLFRQSLSTIETHLGNDHPMLTRTLHNLAALAHREGHREEAGEWLRRGLSIAERRLGTEHPFYGLLLADYAGYLRAGGEKSKAKEMEARSNQVLKDSGRRNGIGSVVDITALRQK
jgi:tetratricopeptide (TPR) repeat protein